MVDRDRACFRAIQAHRFNSRFAPPISRSVKFRERKLLDRNGLSG
jgi:hypothetical protein